MHDEIADLADKMMKLNKLFAPVRNTSCDEREELLQEIKATDEEIDEKVYQLYGLNEEEIQIVADKGLKR
jgi:type II restriction/modification system DNA methylase subunit YeeA